MAKKNPISHVEWRTKNADRLKAFYGAVFNWKFKDSGMPGYTMVDFGNKDIPAGGIFALGDQPMPTGICNYATVDELGPHEDAIKGNGGTILMSNQEVPNVGWFTVFKDPDGNEFALWKQAPPPSKKQKKQAKKAAKKEAKAAKKKKKK
jgi:uncharacterized protein